MKYESLNDAMRAVRMAITTRRRAMGDWSEPRISEVYPAPFGYRRFKARASKVAAVGYVYPNNYDVRFDGEDQRGRR